MCTYIVKVWGIFTARHGVSAEELSISIERHGCTCLSVCLSVRLSVHHMITHMCRVTYTDFILNRAVDADSRLSIETLVFTVRRSHNRRWRQVMMG